jgi:hypothetical protein
MLINKKCSNSTHKAPKHQHSYELDIYQLNSLKADGSMDTHGKRTRDVFTAMKIHVVVFCILIPSSEVVLVWALNSV